MKKLFTVTAIGLALLTWHTSCTQQPKAPEAFTPIKVETPARPAGQEDVIQLVTPKIDTVRVGFIGLGMRGPGAVARWTHIPGTKIVAFATCFQSVAMYTRSISSRSQSFFHASSSPL